MTSRISPAFEKCNQWDPRLHATSWPKTKPAPRGEITWKIGENQGIGLEKCWENTGKSRPKNRCLNDGLRPDIFYETYPPTLPSTCQGRAAPGTTVGVEHCFSCLSSMIYLFSTLPWHF